MPFLDRPRAELTKALKDGEFRYSIGNKKTDVLVSSWTYYTHIQAVCSQMLDAFRDVAGKWTPRNEEMPLTLNCAAETERLEIVSATKSVCHFPEPLGLMVYAYVRGDFTGLQSAYNTHASLTKDAKIAYEKAKSLSATTLDAFASLLGDIDKAVNEENKVRRIDAHTIRVGSKRPRAEIEAAEAAAANTQIVPALMRADPNPLASETKSLGPRRRRRKAIFSRSKKRRPNFAPSH